MNNKTNNKIEYERMWDLIDNHKAIFDERIHNKLNKDEQEWNKFKAKVWDEHFGNAYITRATFESIVVFLKDEKVIEQGTGRGLYTKLLMLKGIDITPTDTSMYINTNIISKEKSNNMISTEKYLKNNKNDFTALMIFFPSHIIGTLNTFKGNKVVYCGNFYFHDKYDQYETLPMGDPEGFRYLNDNFITQRAYPAYETTFGRISSMESVFLLKRREKKNDYNQDYLEFLKNDNVVEVRSGFGWMYSFLYNPMSKKDNFETSHKYTYLYHQWMFKDKYPEKYNDYSSGITNLLIVYPIESAIKVLKGYEGPKLSLVGRFGDYNKNKDILDIGFKEDIDYIKKHFDLVKEYPIVNDPHDWYSFYAFERKN